MLGSSDVPPIHLAIDARCAPLLPKGRQQCFVVVCLGNVNRLDGTESRYKSSISILIIKVSISTLPLQERMPDDHPGRNWSGQRDWRMDGVVWQQIKWKAIDWRPMAAQSAPEASFFPPRMPLCP